MDQKINVVHVMNDTLLLGLYTYLPCGAPVLIMLVSIEGTCTFCLVRTMAGAWTHAHPVLACFVDLEKACDRVPRFTAGNRWIAFSGRERVLTPSDELKHLGVRFQSTAKMD